MNIVRFWKRWRFILADACYLVTVFASLWPVIRWLIQWIILWLIC
jgi:hypothetical protein